MDRPLWDQLSTSSQAAFRFAWAAARRRAEVAGSEVSSAVVDSHDLLVGLLLAHPENSEVAAMFEHFGLIPGQALPAEYPAPTEDGLRRHLASTPENQAPPLMTDVEVLSDAARDLGLSSGSQQVIELRALFAALLAGPNSAQESIRELLDTQGVLITNVADATAKWVANDRRPGYRDWLTQTVPFVPEPVDVPNYKADHGRRYQPSDDFVDISAEVDAFAYLLASRGLDPPLAVGLFGDWGSGKTFFMHALRDRIDRLTRRVSDRPQSEIPYWKHIVQVDFNAWNYVEGELLASLVEEVFSQLRLASDEETNQPGARLAERQRHWLKQLENSRLALEKAQAERQEREERLDAERRRADELRGRFNSEVAELERLRAKRVADTLVTESRSAVTEALEPVAVTFAGDDAGDAIRALDEARKELVRGRAVLDPMVRDPRTIVLLVVALVLTPVIVGVLSFFDVSAVVSVFGGLASAVGLALPVLRSSTSWLKSQLDRVEEAQQLVAGEVRAAREALQAEIAEAEARAEITETALRQVTREEDRLTEEIARIDNELKKTPTQLLGDFIGERVGSSDYRKRLGVPALIRHDFDMLSRLIKDQNVELGRQAESTRDPNVVNRIILYIDDLDRCPEEKVIEVLQAVHLLLAFELFVVVVAVDSRWLADALTRQFPALGTSGDAANPASPDDYLEKIFQIPFWIRPLSTGDRMHITRGLLEGHLIAEATEEMSSGSVSRVTIGPKHRGVLELLDPSMAPPSLGAAALTITRQELAFLDDLAPLMGETPRSVKRFVNLYQLVKVLGRSAALRSRDQPADEPSDNQIAAMMLAIGDGLPNLTHQLMKAVATAAPGSTLFQLVDRGALPEGNNERDLMRHWLDTRPTWQTVTAARLAQSAPLVERFLFRVGERCVKEAHD